MKHFCITLCIFLGAISTSFAKNTAPELTPVQAAIASCSLAGLNQIQLYKDQLKIIYPFHEYPVLGLESVHRNFYPTEYFDLLDAITDELDLVSEHVILPGKLNNFDTFIRTYTPTKYSRDFDALYEKIDAAIKKDRDTMIENYDAFFNNMKGKADKDNNGSAFFYANQISILRNMQAQIISTDEYVLSCFSKVQSKYVK